MRGLGVEVLCGDRSHKEEHQKASLCFFTKVGP